MAASGGTLYLGEIGELPLEIQPKLLRLLQEREYERVGETQTQRADVRIVSSTNRDLRRFIDEGGNGRRRKQKIARAVESSERCTL